MAVTIVEADLIQPLGELDPTFFPGGDLNSKITGWFAQAVAKVEANLNIKPEDHNDAATAWTYYLAYTYIAGRFASMPNSVSVNKGADEVSYGQDRPPFWLARAAAALAAYDGLALIIGKTATPKSMSVPIQVVY